MDFKEEYLKNFDEQKWDKFREICLNIQSSGVKYNFEDQNLLYKSLAVKGSGLSHSAKEFERLEFLGDAILNSIVSEHLYKTYVNFTEKDLTNYRSIATNNIYLAKLCTHLSLDKIAQQFEIGEFNEKQKADVVEAFFGALFLDMEKKPEKFKKLVISKLNFDEIIEEVMKKSWSFEDPKSFLHLLVQKKYKNAAKLEFSCRKLGTQDDRLWEATVVVRKDSQALFSVAGKSHRQKKGAEKLAAKALLEEFKKKGELSK